LVRRETLKPRQTLILSLSRRLGARHFGARGRSISGLSRLAFTHLLTSDRLTNICTEVLQPFRDLRLLACGGRGGFRGISGPKPSGQIGCRRLGFGRRLLHFNGRHSLYPVGQIALLDLRE